MPKRKSSTTGRKSSKKSSAHPLLQFKGKKLGGGDAGTVYQHTEDPNLVIKVVKKASEVAGEVRMQKMMACIGVAPDIIDMQDNAIVMERIVPLEKREVLDAADQQELVNLVAMSVAVGLLHDDLHQGNVGRSAKTGAMVMYDFGFTKQIKPVQDGIVYLELVAGQLYALLDPCNTNNTFKWMCDSNEDESPIVDTIYYIRGGKKRKTAALFRAQKKALQMMHCVEL